LLKNIMENAENRDKNPQFKKNHKSFSFYFILGAIVKV
jgi:hypothetical protein